VCYMNMNSRRSVGIGLRGTRHLGFRHLEWEYSRKDYGTQQGVLDWGRRQFFILRGYLAGNKLCPPNNSPPFERILSFRGKFVVGGVGGNSQFSEDRLGGK
jgi:hypothetical protein